MWVGVLGLASLEQVHLGRRCRLGRLFAFASKQVFQGHKLEAQLVGEKALAYAGRIANVDDVQHIDHQVGCIVFRNQQSICKGRLLRLHKVNEAAEHRQRRFPTNRLANRPVVADQIDNNLGVEWVGANARKAP